MKVNKEKMIDAIKKKGLESQEFSNHVSELLKQQNEKDLRNLNYFSLVFLYESAKSPGIKTGWTI